ncbi:MAG: MFS transporter [Planctomycetaceae bacterium]
MSQTVTPPVSAANRWLVILLLMGFAALGHFNRVGIGVAGTEVFIRPTVAEGTPAPIAPEKTGETRPAFYQVFTEVEMGWIYTAFLVVYTCAMLPGGWLIDRIGSAQALTLLGLTMGSFVMLTGVFGWLMGTPHQLWMGFLVIRGLAGMCSAPLHPGASHAIADVTEPVGRSTGNGLVTAGAVLGISCTYPVFGWMIDRFSWQWAFIISGGVLISYACLWRTLTRGKLPNASHEPIPVAAASDSTSDSPWSLLSHSGLWMVSISYFAYSYYQYLMFYWMNYYFEKVLQVPADVSREYSFAITIAQGAGMFLGGLLTDLICRMVGVSLGRRLHMVGGMGMCALLTLVAVKQTASHQVALFMALAMGAEGMCESVYWTTATELGGRSRGFSGAFLNTIGNVGGFISPVLTPQLAMSMGWTAAIAIACAVCGFGGLLWLWIDTTESKPVASVR